MWWLLACTGALGTVDPDDLLRAGEGERAVAAWVASGGAEIDLANPLAQVMLTRAPTEPTITLESIAEAIEAAELLDARPRLGLRSLDRPITSMRALLAGAERVLRGPVYVAVGRSLSRGDRDAHLSGAALPWQGGRIVGWARSTGQGSLAALGARIDANPPARLITVGLRGAQRDFWIFVERTPDGWLAKTTSDPDAAGPVLLASDREGGP
jgi:hypothetical protein